VDIHGDSLEQAIAPRPATPFPLDIVLPARDAELSVHGITTMYHCVGLADLGNISKPIRNRKTAHEIVSALARFASRSRIRTRIHLRYEILDIESIPCLMEMVQNQKVHLVSIMDHTPGYGVLRDIEAYRRYHLRSGYSLEATDEMIAQRLQLRGAVDGSALEAVVKLCHEKAIAIASHDDHTQDKIGWAKNRGIAIAEFPVTLEAVHAAKDCGIKTVFGTANLIRGESHAENLCATNMVAQGLADTKKQASNYWRMCS
jgi:alpha-D-ribose 1-methylphosphonate 5-triphosphate diphosphatase